MWSQVADQLRDPIGYAIPFFALFIGVELLALRFLDHDEDVRGYDAADSAVSLVTGVVSIAASLLTRGVALVGYAVLHTYVAPWHLPGDAWQTWPAAVVAIDLLFYLYHRCAHRVRLMWAAHQAHHNSAHFNFTTALRQKWNQWFEPFFWLPLPLLGVPPWLVFAAYSVNLIYQFFTHTETVGTLPRPVELVFNTPSHHRVHHGSDPEYLDRNFGGILIVWDRLFGTFQPELHRPTYGLTTPVRSRNPVTLQFHEYGAILRDVRAATTWRERLGHVFGPPA